MKKVISGLSGLLLLSSVLVLPQPTLALDCNAPVLDVKDYPIEITTSVNFRKTIQGAPEDNCPESQVIGSFGVGKVLWVAGEIETGVVTNEETQEYGKWLYLKHPSTGDFGFIWSSYAKKIEVPAGEENHQEIVVENQTGQQSPSALPSSPTTEVSPTECVTIGEVKDFFVKATDGLNIRNGVCNGKIISSLGVGDVVKVIGELGAWYYIEIPGGGKGFIHSEYAVSTAAPVGRENEPEVTIQPGEKAYVGTTPPSSESTTLKDIVGHPYETAIRYLESNGIVKGYPDGLFKADISMNRAEFTKIVVGAKLKGIEPFSSAANCFPDVAKEAWYASYVCYAKDSNIISGYPDKTFRPGDSIQFVEAAKILVNTFALDVKENTEGQWYQPYVEALQKSNYIPITLKKFDQKVNRGEMSEMMWRILQKVTNKSSTQFDFNSGDTVAKPVENNDLLVCADKDVPSSIDMKKVREAWLAWHNKARAQVGAVPLVFQPALSYSSAKWAMQNKMDQTLTHTRKDGQKLGDWFKALGITFKILPGYVYAENIGVQSYSCNQTDCTDEVIQATQAIFNAFVSEKGTDSTRHYDNVVEGDFKQLGLGIAVDTLNNKLYLTTHYAQAVDTSPATCQ